MLVALSTRGMGGGGAVESAEGERGVDKEESRGGGGGGGCRY